MAKGRSGPALYELIRKGGEGGQPGRLATPKWWRTGPAEAPEARTPSAHRPVADKADAAAKAPVVSLPVAQGTQGASSAAAAPGQAAVEFEGGRVVLSLGTIPASAVIVGLLLIVVGAFLGGRKSGFATGLGTGYQAGRDSILAETVDEIELARASAPTEEPLFDDIGASPLNAGSPGARPAGDREGDEGSPEGTVGWIRGYTYIAVQDFRADEHQAALAAQSFLEERGVETAIVELSGDYPYRLLTRRGFNGSNAEQKQRLAAFQVKLEALGREYLKSGGRHALKGYLVKLTQDTW